MDKAELAAWLRLTGTAGIGNQTARRLLAEFGPPQDLFALDSRRWAAVLSPEQLRALEVGPDDLDRQVETTWQWLAQGEGCRHILVPGDPLYPAALLEMADPPLLLYVLGPAELWTPSVWPERALAVVGSRNPTPQGASHARDFSQTLASQGVTVVSGLALGVDAAAHEGALAGSAAGVATIAVVGTGLDRVYPARNRDLARRIAAQGILVSEYPLGTPPLAHHFPQRNRILCGLAQGTLVVEAALQSGSLITARLAADQGKEVFAIPGSIHSPLSKGCHALIRQGAKLVESVDDILEEFPAWSRAVSTGSQSMEPERSLPDSDTCAVLTALDCETCSLDQLQARTGWSTAALQVRLMELELEGLIARLPGGSFQRVHRA